MKHPPVDPFYLKYGKRLRRARKLARLTQEVASGLLAMGQANLSRLETGRQAITLKDLSVSPRSTTSLSSILSRSTLPLMTRRRQGKSFELLRPWLAASVARVRRS